MKRAVKYFVVFWLVWMPFHLFAAGNSNQNSEQLYQSIRLGVFRIQVIDSSTGKKISAGSAFQFDASGLMGTNYHVIADAVNKPERYTIKYIASDESTGYAKIKDIDVINDLAIIQHEGGHDFFLTLSEESLSKGTFLYSFGNLHDKGVIIVEGIYNGLMDKSWYVKILFSGSINPGMSGGPVIDQEGRVVGINVSTSGDQVSYIVPVKFLKLLKEKMSDAQYVVPVDWHPVIEEQLKNNMTDIINQMLEIDWESVPVGEALVPGEMTKAFSVWGGPSETEKEDDLYSSRSLYSTSEEKIFIEKEFYTGTISCFYIWLTSKGLNPFRFYELLENFYIPVAFDNAGEDKVEQFISRVDFVSIDGKICKVSFSLRPYKKYSDFYDMYLDVASLCWEDRGFIAKLKALGLRKNDALRLSEKFLRDIKWKK